MSNIAIIPIRDDSTRLKKKATGFCLYKNYTPLECMIERLLLSRQIDQIIFIMPDTKENDKICKAIDGLKFNLHPYSKIYYFKGSINDISGRALEAINFDHHKTIINITADCPLIDPKQIDFLLFMHKRFLDKPSYITNVLTRSWPDGFDIQIYDSSLLWKAWTIARDKKETTNMGWDIVNYSGFMRPFNIKNYPASEDYFFPEWGLTLDYKEDIEVISAIYNHFDSFDFTAEQVIDYLKDNMYILDVNKHCRRNIPGCSE